MPVIRPRRLVGTRGLKPIRLSSRVLDRRPSCSYHLSMSTIERVPRGVKLFDPTDVKTRRQLVFEGVLDAVRKKFPVSYKGVRMELGDDLEYVDPEHYSLEDQHRAKMRRETLARRLRGTVNLFDEGTGELLDSKKMTLMSVPWMTDRGTFLHNGTDYTTASQMRLVPGAFARWTDAGEAETHFNARPGSGPSLRISLVPETGQLKLHAGPQSSVHLYSVLKDIGVSDEDMTKAWGVGVVDINAPNYNPRALDQAYRQLVPEHLRDMNAPRELKIAGVRSAFDSIETMENAVKATGVDWDPPSEKQAGVSRADLVEMANFLNVEQQAGIPLDAPAAELEVRILQFLDMQMPDADTFLGAVAV